MIQNIALCIKSVVAAVVAGISYPYKLSAIRNAPSLRAQCPMGRGVPHRGSVEGGMGRGTAGKCSVRVSA